MKKIVKIVENCLKCEYLQYNPNLTSKEKPGYDCVKSLKRIVDDNNLVVSDWPTIPDWCELSEMSDGEYIIFTLENDH